MKTWKQIERDNEVAVSLQMMELQCQQVGAGYQRAAYLFGPPGIGKNFVLDEALILFKMRGHERVDANPANYREMLAAFEEAAGERPIVFDECDVIWSSTRMMQIINIATDPKRGRSRRVYQDVDVSAPFFVLTNLDLRDSTKWSKNLQHYGPPVFRRIPPSGVSTEASRRDLWEHSVGLALYHGLLDKARIEVWGVSREQPRALADRVQALKWFSEQRDNLSSVSPATLIAVAEAFDASGDACRLKLDALLVPPRKRRAPLHDTTNWRSLLLGPQAVHAA